MAEQLHTQTGPYHARVDSSILPWLRVQAELVAMLAVAGEIEMAEQLHAQAGLPGPRPVADPATRAARIAADAAKYLQPVLGADAVCACLDLGVLYTA